MSDFDDYEDDGSNLVADLRKALKEANKSKDALEKELTSLRAQTRTSTISDKIASRGLDARVAAIIPADVDDLDSWLDTYGDLFGGKAPDAGDDAGAVDEELDGIAGQSEAEKAGSDDDGLLSKITNTDSFEALAALIKGA